MRLEGGCEVGEAHGAYSRDKDYVHPARACDTKSVAGKSAFETAIQRCFFLQRVFLLVARRATSQTQVRDDPRHVVHRVFVDSQTGPRPCVTERRAGGTTDDAARSHRRPVDTREEWRRRRSWTRRPVGPGTGDGSVRRLRARKSRATGSLADTTQRECQVEGLRTIGQRSGLGELIL